MFFVVLIIAHILCLFPFFSRGFAAYFSLEHASKNLLRAAVIHVLTGVTLLWMAAMLHP